MGNDDREAGTASHATATIDAREAAAYLAVNIETIYRLAGQGSCRIHGGPCPPLISSTLIAI